MHFTPEELKLLIDALACIVLRAGRLARQNFAAVVEVEAPLSAHQIRDRGGEDARFRRDVVRRVELRL